MVLSLLWIALVGAGTTSAFLSDHAHRTALQDGLSMGRNVEMRGQLVRAIVDDSEVTPELVNDPIHVSYGKQNTSSFELRREKPVLA